MKVRYSETATARTLGGVPCHFQTDQAVTWLPREACFMAGFTDTQLDAAEANPGEWIVCPREREEPADPKVEALTNICAGVTEIATEALRAENARLTRERDALLKACKRARELCEGLNQRDGNEFPVTLPMLNAAIALAEPKTPC